MPANLLTGTRIRDRRSVMGLKQADLAREVGISPSYLNLIEHNRRRIGGKLLSDLARALDVDPSALSEGAAGALLDLLRAVASEDTGKPEPEVDRIEEFAGRFPGWSSALTRAQNKIERLERTIATLTDRLAHDPNLSASLHEVLSTVTAIRSTASILADPEGIDPNWQARFLKNIDEDARRLSESAQALVGYLDNAPDADRGLTSPFEELETWLERQQYHIAALEGAANTSIESEISGLAIPDDLSGSARETVYAYLSSYRSDALAMPLDTFRDIAAECKYDPAAVSARMGVPLPAVLRRLATLPPGEKTPDIGRVACDGSGLLTFRKEVPGFPLPRFAAACPLWPLYQALLRPAVPVCARLVQVGRDPRAYVAFAFAQPEHPEGFSGPTIIDAQMILIQEDYCREANAMPLHEVGQTCRICPRPSCPARRESSILASSLDA